LWLSLVVVASVVEGGSGGGGGERKTTGRQQERVADKRIEGEQQLARGGWRRMNGRARAATAPLGVVWVRACSGVAARGGKQRAECVEFPCSGGKHREQEGALCTLHTAHYTLHSAHCIVHRA